MLTPSASRQSAVPHWDEAARLPCLATFMPPAAATRAEVVEMLKLWALSPPVPTISKMAMPVSTFVAWSRMAAALSSAEALRWISLAGAAAALEPAASNGSVAKAAEHAAAKRAEVQIEQVKVDSTAAATLESYFNFGAYAIISSVIVSVGLVFSGMNEPERVRRMEAGPVSERQRSLAVFAAAAVLTVCIWLVSSMMGIVGFASAVAEVGVGRVCLALAATFALACTPLAVGFTLSSLGAREELLNGVGNLLGMLMTFLGGAWMPLSLMGSAVQTVAHFVPTYWVNDAISKALASDLTSAVLSDIACDLGVTVLFAAAIAAVGLALAHAKSRA